MAHGHGGARRARGRRSFAGASSPRRQAKFLAQLGVHSGISCTNAARQLEAEALGILRTALKPQKWKSQGFDAWIDEALARGRAAWSSGMVQASGWRRVCSQRRGQSRTDEAGQIEGTSSGSAQTRAGWSIRRW